MYDRVPLVAWTLYATVVAGLTGVGLYEGVIQKLLAADASFISVGLIALFLVAEGTGLLDLLAKDTWDTPKTSFTHHLCDTIVLGGVAGTIFGIIWAFLPLLGGTIDVDTLRQHLPQFFSGVAVSFIPTGISFVLKALLDSSIYIREHA
jgi:hypothetical protein